MKSYKITQRLGRKPNAQEAYPLYFRTFFGDKQDLQYTGISVTIDQWDKKQQLIIGHTNAKLYNLNLQKRLADLNQSFCIAQMNNEPFSLQQGKEKKKKDSFYSLVMDHIESLDTHSTKRGYLSRLEILKNYVGVGKELLISEVTVKFVEDFKSYCKNILGNDVNTVSKKLSFLKMIMNKAVHLDLIKPEQNPFLYKIKLTSAKTKDKTLDLLDLRKIANLQIKAGTKMEVHRDVFLFATCAFGLRVSDVLLLTRREVEHLVLSTTTIKNEIDLNSDLPDDAIRILNKYISHTQNPDDYVFPLLRIKFDKTDIKSLKKSSDFYNAISSATTEYNTSLKKISKLAKIKKFSTHSARYSFAGLSQTKGSDNGALSHMMQHEDIKTTMKIYMRPNINYLKQQVAILNKKEYSIFTEQ